MSHIMIVDDKSENLYLLRALLQGHGHTVEEARHGAEALAKARMVVPHMIVSDLLMPVMDGYTLLRHWRSDDRLKGIPFVVYTATYTEPRDKRLAISLGADAFIVKPAEPDVFMEHIREVMAKHSQGQLPSSTDRPGDDGDLLNEYNHVLVAKLEKKARELEESNLALQADAIERQAIEAELRLLTETMPQIVWMARPDGQNIYFNQRWVAFTGLSVEESHGQGWIKLLHQDDQESTRVAWQQATTRGDNYSQECRLRRSDGLYRWMLVRGLPCRDEKGRIIKWMGTCTDIDDLKSAQALVAEQAALLDKTQDAILVRNLKHRITYWNRGAERLYGWSAEEVLCRSARDLLYADPQAFDAGMESVIANGEWSGTLVHVRRDKRPVDIEARWVLVRDEQNQPKSILAINTDVTERRKLEEQLRQSQKMEAVGRLAGGVAHDFNNLLTIISGHSALLLNQSDLSPGVIDSIRAISDAGERAAAMTRQLLGFSRQTMLQPKVLDINAVIINTAKMLRRLIGENIELTTVLDPAASPVKVDPNQLDQVLMNLAVNARDAMPDGGKLTIETANITISDDYAATHLDCRAGHHVMLAITDTGCGMPPDVQARIFEPFFTTKEIGKGTGLGLAMVYGIVQQSNGCIHVYSEAGHGTTFKIYLPAITDMTTTPTNAPPSRAAGRGTETILLVEDDRGVRGLAQLALQTQGYTVLIATDGKDALKVVEDHRGPLDLVLTDVVMPNISGPDMVKALHAKFPSLKVLFMSGYTSDSVVRHGLLEARVSFIQKPYTPTALAQKVRLVLDNQDTAAG